MERREDPSGHKPPSLFFLGLAGAGGRADHLLAGDEKKEAQNGRAT
jgi:hypothetical protein